MVSRPSDQVQAVRRVLDEAFADKKFATATIKARHDADMDDLADRVVYLMAAKPDLYDPSHGLIRLARHLRLAGVSDDYQAKVAALWRDHPMLSTTKHSPLQALGVWLPSWDRHIKNFHERTDMGLAARLVDRFGTDIARSAELGWFGWAGSHWKSAEDKVIVDPRTKEMIRRLDYETEWAAAKAGEEGLSEDDQNKARDRAHKYAMSAQAAGKVAAVRELAVSEGGVTVDATEWDADPALLGTPGGTLELGDMVTLRPAQRVDRITKTTATSYDRGDQGGDRWESFLADMLPDEDVRRYFQKLAGYSLYGANTKRLIVFLIGPTSTGKSTVLAAIAKVLGDYAGAFEMSMFRGKEQEAPRPDLIEALPKRFLHTSEAADRWVLHADEIKRALGGADQMRARKMRKDEYLVRQPAFTPFVATNNVPTIKGADTALWKRITVVPCTRQIATDDEREELARELVDADGPAILAWLIDGWELYKAEGLTNVPHACAEATMDLTTSLEPVDVWLAETTEANPEAVTTMNDLWITYTAWCDAAGVTDKGSKMTLGKALTGRGYAVTKTGPENKRVAARRGLRLVAVSAEN